MNILFVLYHDFSTASAIHVHNFANGLVRAGCRCAVAVPDNKESRETSISGEYLYDAHVFRELLSGKDVLFQGEGPEVVHAWTPREVVRQFTLLLLEKFRSCRLIVHLEDNEETITETFAGIPFNMLERLGEKKLETLLPTPLSYPGRYRNFLERADGVTVIVDELLEFIPSGKKNHRLWPVIDTERFHPSVRESEFVSCLTDAECMTLCYVGSVHAVNALEVKSLYLAVILANREGLPVRLIRAGRDTYDFLGSLRPSVEGLVTELGYVEMEEVPRLMAAATVLVQPGLADRFNRYRLPSKIPEFLAMGKPVVVPEVNIGLHLRHGWDAIVLKRGDAASIVQALKLIWENQNLSGQLGSHARRFAEEHFREEAIIRGLVSFYRKVLSAEGKSRQWRDD